MRRRLLLDENIPVGVRGILAEYDVQTAPQMGWAGITNGGLISVAEDAGFEIMLTADSNIKHQQNLTGRKLSLVVLTTNHWDTIKTDLTGVLVACNGAGVGTYTVVQLPRPLPRRRQPPLTPR